MSEKIAFVGEFLLSFKGGGEKSIFNVLKELAENKEVVAYTFDKLHKRGKFKRKGIKVTNFGSNLTLPYLKFKELFFNHRYFWNKLEKMKEELQECDYVITQGLIVPTVARFCVENDIEYHSYLRDEYHLNEFNNYERGFRRFLKYAKMILQYPFIRWYKKWNKFALQNADRIVANSKFMKTQLKEKFGLDAEVRYPEINEEKYEEAEIDPKEQEYITFIGGENHMKGFDVVLKIAKKMQEEKFLIVGPYKEKKEEKNITFLPWQDEVLDVYKKTKMLLVPSKWKEAFGRVVVEANLLGIPTITSDRGGLPESNLDKNLILKSLKIDTWVQKIKELLRKEEVADDS